MILNLPEKEFLFTNPKPGKLTAWNDNQLIAISDPLSTKLSQPHLSMLSNPSPPSLTGLPTGGCGSPQSPWS